MKNYDGSILLINNDSELMSNFSIILGDYGYNLRVALDPETATDMILRKKIDLIIIDFSFEKINPYGLFDEIVRLKPEIPRITVVTKEILDDPDFAKIYPFIYDIVIKPVVDVNDFRMRIRRGIENTKLLRENREYQKIMIEKTFRIGMLDIFSSIIHQVNIDVDKLLASMYLWKEECVKNFKDKKDLKKFNENFNSFKEKLLNIEEKIQLNEVLLSEHKSDKGIILDIMLTDMIETMKETLESYNIRITTSFESINPTRLDSVKIVQCFFYLMENSLSYLKLSSTDREIRISCRNLTVEKKDDYIEAVIYDNSDSKDIDERLKVFDRDYYEDTSEKRFSLYDIKKYIDSIGGSLYIKQITNGKTGGFKTTICFPVI